jgi:hypothetical protein
MNTPPNPASDNDILKKFRDILGPHGANMYGGAILLHFPVESHLSEEDANKVRLLLSLELGAHVYPFWDKEELRKSVENRISNYPNMACVIPEELAANEPYTALSNLNMKWDDIVERAKTTRLEDLLSQTTYIKGQTSAVRRSSSMMENDTVKGEIVADSQRLLINLTGIAWKQAEQNRKILETMPMLKDPKNAARVVCRVLGFEGEAEEFITIENNRVCIPTDVLTPTSIIRLNEWAKKINTSDTDEAKKANADFKSKFAVLAAGRSRES